MIATKATARECLNWHGEEVEHRLSYLSVESRSREGDQHRPQSSCPAPMYGRPLGNPPSNWEVSDAHDFDAFIIGQRLPYRCFGNKRLTAHSAHRRQRELLRHLQHVHGIVTAALSKIRCHGQRADENDSGEHRRNPRSGAWVRSFTWHRSRRRRVAPFHLGFTEAASWIPKLNLRLHFRADGCPPPREVPSSFDPFGLADPTTPRVAVADTGPALRTDCRPRARAGSVRTPQALEPQSSLSRI